MAGNGGGSIISMTSASVHALLYHHAGYIATKAAGEALVRCFANEFGAKGVKVNCIAPGLTASPMTATGDGAARPAGEHSSRNIRSAASAPRTTSPTRRCGSRATESFITGQVLQINGGLTLRRNPSAREISASLRAAKEAAGKAPAP